MAGTRPKGFIYGFNPRPQTIALIEQVQSVLEEYSAQLPLTARQIFYRLVGQYDYDKTEQAYARLCEALVKARRAQIIPFSSIRDDGTVERGGKGMPSVAAWWEAELGMARAFTRDRTHEQDVEIELWCEAAGMVPQLLRVANPFDVKVFSTGGFSSVTVTYEIAQRVAGRERPTVFLHVGDFDPSGESIFESMTADVQSFVEDMTDDDDWSDWFRPERVALTADQVRRYRLPTAPPKKSDTRSRSWVGETCQAEAMDPATLADVVREAVTAHIDLGMYEAVLALEKVERARLVADVEEVLRRRKDGKDGEA